ncbi:pseudouridine synthase [Synechococcus sp. KORDI-100]|uniref:pseudouridine synthase n=1 Tax=Synechococcus sp. KORDI-100 TaxID=1280380 RepID=UPI000B1F1708
MSAEGLAELHRDDWLLAVEKPAGLLSQPGLGMHQQDSVITRLQRNDPDLQLAHRLDRDTSGVLLLARGQDALRRCNALFARRDVHKLYVADVMGVMRGSGVIHAPLARLQRHPPRYGSSGGAFCPDALEGAAATMEFNPFVAGPVHRSFPSAALPSG